MSTETPPTPAGAERFGAWFDEAAAQAACEFFPRYLRHTEGEWAGQPFELADWQRDEIIRPLFGWKREDGTRLYRRFYGEVAKKNGKTELAAGLALLALLGDAEFGGQGFSIATDKDQAKIVFNKAAVMVDFSEDLKAELDLFKTSIYCGALGATFKPISSAPTGKHGFSTSFFVGDEVHEWANDSVYDAVRKNTAARRQPLEILITTAGLRGQGVAWEIHEHARKVLEGAIEDPEQLVVIHAADPEDDWKDPKVWAKANPNMGISPKLDFLRAECTKAQQSPRLENSFKRYHLNMWTEQATRWLPMDHWKLCSADPSNPELWKQLEDRLRGRRCFSGVDLASTRDLNSLCHGFPPVEEDPLWTFLWRFWLPRDGVEERSKKSGVDFQAWHKDGALVLTPGNVSDYKAIKAQIFADAEVFQIGGLAIDRWNATQMAVDLADEGLKVVLFGQGFASMSAPSKELERMVMAHEFDHGNHPVARWMASNVAAAEDTAGNLKPAKDKSTGQIDGIVAQIMALALGSAGDDEQPSVYELLAQAAAAEAQAQADGPQPDADEIDWAALNDVNHPRFAEMAKLFEERQAAMIDDD